MSYVAKVTTKGQMTLPAELRAELHIEPGDKVSLTRQEDGSYRLKRMSNSLEDLRGIIKLDRPMSIEDIIAAVDAARDERAAEIMGRFSDERD